MTVATKVLVMLAIRNRSSAPRGAPVLRLPTPAAPFQMPPLDRDWAVTPGMPARTTASMACRVS
ncbi:hypothetical protein A6A29_21770 [Streptomyces sp. TSRI0281]|nr:hypothetical protein A6A29_21770 [Streptomyces sp. TSRI0281]